MHYAIIYSDEAIETFGSIGDQLQTKWGEKEVNEFRKRTFKVIDIISNFPLIFQAVKNSDNIRKAFIHKNVRCFTR